MNRGCFVACALWLGSSAVAYGETQTPPTLPSSPVGQRCEGLTGNALERCRRDAAAGLSNDAATRYGGTSPGSTGDATARPSTPPRRADSAEQGRK